MYVFLHVNMDILGQECVDFRVVWKKINYDVTFPLDEKAIKLKEHIESLTGMQELLLRIINYLNVALFLQEYHQP